MGEKHADRNACYAEEEGQVGRQVDQGEAHDLTADGVGHVKVMKERAACCRCRYRRQGALVLRTSAIRRAGPCR